MLSLQFILLFRISSLTSYFKNFGVTLFKMNLSCIVRTYKSRAINSAEIQKSQLKTNTCQDLVQVLAAHRVNYSKFQHNQAGEHEQLISFTFITSFQDRLTKLGGQKCFKLGNTLSKKPSQQVVQLPADLKQSRVSQIIA
ncbi:unnamed protein product [Paramecium octaurelia]|uniref:Uncharacterized protein n=1 Tax=Paramecium octaurelia TaxID=43137 RepID=A0A8S1YHP3_PAROT|nr:unnamed protein product [Paramecium octaurelia]